LTTTFQAPVIATQGNFYGISSASDVQGSIPLDSNGQPFVGNDTMGSSWIIADQPSGMTLQLQSSLQYNLQVFNDDVFWIDNNSTYGTFVPRVWVLKQMTLSPTQITNLLGFEQSIRTTEWVLFGLCLGVGLVLLGVGAMVLLKFLKAKKLSQATSE
jgi:hypothetical protein